MISLEKLTRVITNAMIDEADGKWELYGRQVFDPDSNTLVDPARIADAVLRAISADAMGAGS